MIDISIWPQQAMSPLVDLSHLTLNSTLADLPTHRFEVSPNTPGQIVASEFERQPDLPGVIVAENSRLYGAFSRRKFLERVGRPYGVEVYLRRPIQIMLQAIPARHLQLSSSHLIHSATRMALSRPADAIYEPIVVEFPDKCLRLLNIYTLLLAQSQLLNLGYQLEQNRRQFAEALHKTGQALSSTLNLHEVTELILQELDQVVDYDRGAVMLRRGDCLDIIAHHGFPQDARIDDIHIAVTVQNTLFQRLITSQVPMLIGDVTAEPTWQQVSWLPVHCSWLGVPLVAQDRVIGMLSLTRAAPNAFSADDTNIVLAFADQAAIALENARLYEQILGFNDHLEQMVEQRSGELNKAYARLARIDKTKSDFIKISAHELRTPITVIKGYAQVLAAHPALKDDINAAPMLEGIAAGVSRLHQIVNNILDVAKIDNDELKILPEQVLLMPMIEHLCRKLEPDLSARHLNLKLADLNPLPVVQADPDLLPKVFYNLMINAIKYTPDGGTISITGQVVSAACTQSQVEIAIRDTGIGINPDQLDFIFEKFYQTGDLALHSSGQIKFKGTGPGLGLAIAKGIVERHGGQIWAESQGYDEESCPGSCFYDIVMNYVLDQE